MFIQTEQTPNPASLKFLPGCEVMGADGTADFKKDADHSASPLAARLFGIEGITGVFLGADFITLTKAENATWPALKPLVLGLIMEHFSTGQPVMRHESTTTRAATPNSRTEDDDEIVTQIKELLDTRIRPAVAGDGGDIVFDSFVDGVVYLHMRGACSGCPSSTVTLKSGIENLLRHFIPEVTEVRAVED